jgi:MoaA/NifB/PqqE/SkfB family radical SAM enzyme
MRLSTRNYWSNLFRLLGRNRLLRPQVFVYYLTARCNLDCAYCEDFGMGRNEHAPAELALEEALRVLRVLRSGTDRLILTGGEPLLYPDIVPLAAHAKQELGFTLTLTTNGLLLPQSEATLEYVDRLVISLDSVDPERWGTTIGASAQVAQAILEHICFYARRQRATGYRIIVNCVLTPETLPGARDVLLFCAENDLLVSFSPQAVNNWPRYDLLVSDEYTAFVHELIEQKRRGAPILGSKRYLHTVKHFRPYSCYPALVPRVMPNGDLAYPCRPIEKEQGSLGGRPCNLLDVNSWEQAFQSAVAAYGTPPRMCNCCFLQCYAEPSLMQAHPLSLLWEVLRHGSSRRGGLASFVPG